MASLIPSAVCWDAFDNFALQLWQQVQTAEMDAKPSDEKRKRRCPYCKVEINSSNYSKHIKLRCPKKPRTLPKPKRKVVSEEELDAAKVEKLDDGTHLVSGLADGSWTHCFDERCCYCRKSVRIVIRGPGRLSRHIKDAAIRLGLSNHLRSEHKALCEKRPDTIIGRFGSATTDEIIGRYGVTSAPKVSRGRVITPSDLT